MRSTPAFATAPHGSMGRHEAMALAGPTPDNPFLTLKKRLKRARFYDGRERMEYESLLAGQQNMRSEEHTSELQSLMRISYAVFCLKKKTAYSQTYYDPHS